MVRRKGKQESLLVPNVHPYADVYGSLQVKVYFCINWDSVLQINVGFATFRRGHQSIYSFISPQSQEEVRLSEQ